MEMDAMPQISEGKKRQIVTLGTQGCSHTQLAAEFDTTQSNVSKLLKKHRITGEVKDMARSGRPGVTDVHDGQSCLTRQPQTSHQRRIAS